MKWMEYGIPEELSQVIIDYIDEIKELLSSEIWETIFLDCSKNEILVLWLIYQREEVNMTEIADYIHVPLNTATGIMNRMEKNGWIVRTRSKEDKRVVRVTFSEKGRALFEEVIGEMISYGMKVVCSFTKEEMELFYKMTSKIMEILKQENRKKKAPRKVRKIQIE